MLQLTSQNLHHAYCFTRDTTKKRLWHGSRKGKNQINSLRETYCINSKEKRVGPNNEFPMTGNPFFPLVTRVVAEGVLSRSNETGEETA